MTLKALTFKPGLNLEGTRYSATGTWADSDKIRFRQGLPEKIGGWQRVSSGTYLGICRSLTQWSTLGGFIYTGVGSNLKYYIASGGAYYDITPIRETDVLNNPFDTTINLATVTVHHTAHGATNNSYVTFSGAAAVGGLTLNAEYQLTYVDANTYTITAGSLATSTVTGGGGAAVSAAYQVNAGNPTQVPVVGWGAGTWGTGTWGHGTSTHGAMRLWNADNFGEDLVFGPKGGTPYYWSNAGGLTTRGVALSTIAGASDVPLTQNFIIVSDINRFVLFFGTNEFGSVTQDQMVIRWSDQESAGNWTPSATTQAGDLRLSRGSKIVCGIQTRQEIVIFTDTSVYSLQYVGAPAVWGATFIADNVSIMGTNACATSSGIVYWMGQSKFYYYDGVVHTLDCDVRRYVFDNLNSLANEEVFAGVVESFNEIWWFYCSGTGYEVDSYVVYNYVDKAWYIGTMRRSAWVSSGLTPYSVAASYDNNNLVYQEVGVDDEATSTPVAIEAYITSAELDIGDGFNYGLINRVIPDVTFNDSTADTPQATMTLIPMKFPGSGYQSPASLGGQSSAAVSRIVESPIEEFTKQIYVRVRGRQLVFKISSTGLGTKWQLGTPRADVRPDGRNG